MANLYTFDVDYNGMTEMRERKRETERQTGTDRQTKTERETPPPVRRKHQENDETT